MFQRQKEKDLIRIKSIKKVLSSIVKQRGNYKVVAKAEKTELKKLAEAEGNFSYDPMGYEFIRFDNWFSTKLPEHLLIKEQNF